MMRTHMGIIFPCFFMAYAGAGALLILHPVFAVLL
jgi:hypothetical protein